MLRRGRHLPRRNTRYQAGATPYLGRTFTGWIAPASPGVLLLLHRSGLSPHTPCQSPGALTRVAACTLARSPIRDPLSEGFRHFVSSMPAPVASGWSESPGGACTHWKAPPCHGAPPLRPLPGASRGSQSGITRRRFRPERSIGVGRTWAADKGRAEIGGDGAAGHSGRIGSLAHKRTPPKGIIGSKAFDLTA